MKKIVINSIILFICYALLYSCAIQENPTGGIKDIIPPKATKFSPNNYSTSFDKKKIIITFDEFVKVTRLNENLLISPPMKNNPDFRTSGKSLIIEISDTLKPNTTYQIYMGEAIGDLHEDNPLKNFRYTFSTGEFIDSLELIGSVKDAFTYEPAPNVLVMLYKKGYDSIPYLELPDYISKTDEDGIFHFKSLQDNSYKIFALNDINSNYLFDISNEAIATLDSLVQPYYIQHNELSDSIMSDTSYNIEKHIDQNKYPLINLLLYQEQDTLFRYYEKLEDNRLISIGFNQPVEDLNLKILKPSNIEIQTENIEKDSINIWLNNYHEDSLSLQLKSESKNLDDTLIFYYSPTKRDIKNLKNSPLDIDLLNREYSVFYKEPRLVFNRPIDTTYRSNRVKISNGVDTLDLTYELDNLKTVITPFKWDEEANNYQIIIGDSAFRDIYGKYNKQASFNLNYLTKTNYGTLIINLNKKEDTLQNGSTIIQLLEQESKEIIREAIVKNDTTIYFDFLEPNNYLLKSIQDNNNNGKWDGGIYLRNIKPEEVNFYPEPIKIIIGWEIVIDLEL